MTDAAIPSVSTSAISPRPAARRPELDVLTTLIVFSLIPFHTLGIFNGYQGIVYQMKSQLATLLLSLVVVSEFIWIMPVMMFVAGIAIYYSLQRRSTGQFVQERLLRLGIPFLTGLALANPPQLYYALKLRAGLQESFWRFYPRYWNIRFSLLSFPYFLEPAGAEQTFNVIHLWFLIFLLVYTLLLVPLFILLRRPAGARVVQGVAGFFSKRFAIFLWAIPTALLEAFVGPIWPSGWCRWIWPFIILYGFLCAADERLTQALARHRVAGLVWGFVGFLVFFMGMGILMQSQLDPWMDHGPMGTAFRFVKGLASWFLVVGIAGLATRLGERARARREADPAARGEAPRKPGFWQRAIAYGREAQLPYYVLHQTPIIVIGYYVIQWMISPLLMWVIITVASIAIVLLVYEFLVRRIPVLRFLFGMRARLAKQDKS